MNKFWIIVVGGKGVGEPRQHPTEPESHEEAERLAKLPDNVGRKVFVFGLESYCVMPEVAIEWHIPLEDNQNGTEINYGATSAPFVGNRLEN